MNSLIAQIHANLKDSDYALNEMEDGSAVILDARRERLLTLNATASLIIAAIRRGVHSERALADSLTARFQVEPNDVQADLGRFLEQIDSLLKR
jgi:hypothetical protein